MLNLFFKQKEKSLGLRGEELAQKEYKKRGYKIVGRNIFNRHGKQAGEIDFIAKNRTSVVFVEVKTRTQAMGKFGAPEDAVNFFKQQKFLKAVKLYLAAHPGMQKLRPQIDVCAVVMSPIDRAESAKGGMVSRLFNRVDKTPVSVTILPNVVEDQF